MLVPTCSQPVFEYFDIQILPPVNWVLQWRNYGIGGGGELWLELISPRHSTRQASICRYDEDVQRHLEPITGLKYANRKYVAVRVQFSNKSTKAYKTRFP